MDNQIRVSHFIVINKYYMSFFDIFDGQIHSIRHRRIADV